MNEKEKKLQENYITGFIAQGILSELLENSLFHRESEPNLNI